MGEYKASPTLYPAPDFSAADDAATLRAAMKGLGTDEQAIIDVLCSRSNAQRQAIAAFFSEEYGRDLVDDLKSELGGHFEDCIVALMRSPEDYLCRQLHGAMEGAGTDEGALIEILCTRGREEIARLVDRYEELYGRPLAEHVCGETGGDLRRLLTLVVTGVREDAVVDAERARLLAQQLHEAGEAKLGTDEHVFCRILARESFAQLRRTFEEYKEVAGTTIEQAIRHETDGDLRDALLAVVECVQCPAAYFARRLHEAMSGAGTDDATLIRVVVTRAELDLQTVKDEYERIYDKTLASQVKGETSGDYKHALIALIEGK